MIKIAITPLQAIEFIRWKKHLHESVNKSGPPDADFLKMHLCIDSIATQIEHEFFKDITVGTIDESKVEQLEKITHGKVHNV